MPTAESLTIREPDDWHLHLRDDAMLDLIADFSARQFARAIIMPNLVPPVTTVAAAEAYRERILNVLPTGRRFTPLMTAYLTDEIDPNEIGMGYERGVFTSCKLYPAGATTNSDAGVTDIRNIQPVLERMQAMQSEWDVAVETNAEELAADEARRAAILEAIDAVADGTSFNGQQLLNGEMGYVIENKDISDISWLQIHAARLGQGGATSVPVQIDVNSPAAKAAVFIDVDSTNGSGTFNNNGGGSQAELPR